MMQANLTLLRTVALAFRRGFMNADLSNAPGALPHFPDGCCNWGSYMMGHFLKYEQRLKPFEVIGERFAPDGTDQHSWLRVDEIIVDITSDEFPDSEAPVIVGLSSEWHKNWEVVQTNPIQKIQTFDRIGGRGTIRVSEIYELVAAEARQSLRQVSK